MKFLSKTQLEALTTRRLLKLYGVIRAKVSGILYYSGPRCCEICHEYIGDDWQKDVGDVAAPWEEYKALIKDILSTREHVKRKRCMMRE